MKKLILILVVVIICILGIKTIKLPTKIVDESKIDFIVNKDNPLSENYVPKDLVKVDISFLDEVEDEEKMMTKESADALIELVNAAANDGIILQGVSAYRSYKTQHDIYKNSIKQYGKKYTESYVAKPGKTEHQLGLVMDLGGAVDYITEGSQEAIWIEENSYKYGFVLRYPKGKEDITGYNYEPWHIRYVGKSIAEKAYRSNKVLEELQ